LAAVTQAINELQAHTELPADDAFVGELAHLQATLARFQGDSVAAIHWAQVAQRHLPPERKSSRAAVLLNLAMAYIASGDTAAASQTLTEATAVDPQSQISQGAWQGLAWLHVRQGQLQIAQQIYQQAIAHMMPIDGRPLPTSGAAYVGLSEVLMARYELTAAQTALQTGVARLRGSIEQILLAIGYGRLAQIHQALGDPSQAQAVLAEADTWLAQMRLTDLGFGRIIAGYRALLALRWGNLPAAAQWIDDSGLLPDVQPNSISEMLYPILVRVLLANGRIATAQTILDALHQQMMARQWHGQLVEIYLLQALLHQAQNHHEAALAALKQALALAEVARNVFFFMDEGKPVADLLSQVGEPQSSTAFVTRLRQLFGQTAHVVQTILPEALSEREMEVLLLVAAGAPNREIANRLFIAVPTVKKHMSNILVKLDASNRTQAISRAREIGLIT
jgi:LuxR family maltose regulon positive regulatory protein